MKYTVLAFPQPSDRSLSYEAQLPAVFRHPFYGWTGLRSLLAQHTAAEHELMRRWAAGRSRLVEIGVAEGVSALALREVMSATGRLYLIDPFHLSRIRFLNFTKRAAHRAVGSFNRGEVVWIERFSSDAAKTWNSSIDFLLIDGDHSEAGVRSDWESWSRFVEPGGVVLFHDARLFDGGWTSQEYAPVKLVDELFRCNQNREWKIVAEIHSLVVVERATNGVERIQS